MAMLRFIWEYGYVGIRICEYAGKWVCAGYMEVWVYEYVGAKVRSFVSMCPCVCSYDVTYQC